MLPTPVQPRVTRKQSVLIDLDAMCVSDSDVYFRKEMYSYGDAHDEDYVSPNPHKTTAVSAFRFAMTAMLLVAVFVLLCTYAPRALRALIRR